jgi:hypothetical protein
VKRGDWLWALIFTAASLSLAWPGGSDQLMALAGAHRYGVGFLAFALLGPLGDTLAGRLSGQDYPRLAALLTSALMWGLLGLAAALLFWVINGGVVMAQTVGWLPGGGFVFSGHPLKKMLTSFFFTEPFFSSLLVNLIWPEFMAALRLGESCVNLRLAGGRWPGLARSLEAVDWAAFLRVEVATRTLVRVPLLTAVFMLPQDLWLALAAWLGAALTGLSALATRPGKIA